MHVGTVDLRMSLRADHLVNSDACTFILLDIIFEGHEEDPLVLLAEVAEPLTQLWRPHLGLVRPVAVPLVETPRIPQLH